MNTYEHLCVGNSQCLVIFVLTILLCVHVSRGTCDVLDGLYRFFLFYVFIWVFFCNISTRKVYAMLRSASY